MRRGFRLSAKFLIAPSLASSVRRLRISLSTDGKISLVYESCADAVTKDAHSPSEVITLPRIISVAASSGITTETTRTTIDNSINLSGDFILNFELTAKPLNESDEGNVNGALLLGYKDYNFPEYCNINFTSEYHVTVNY